LVWAGWSGDGIRTCPNQTWGTPSLLYNEYVPGLFPGVKRPGQGVDHPPHLGPRLKKEHNYTSTSPLGLKDLFYGKLYLTV